MTEKLRFGIVGLSVGGNYIENLRNNRRAELVAVCDLDDSLLAAPKVMGLPNSNVLSGLDVYKTKNYKDILNGCDLDVVVVATPDHLHRDHVVQALKMGKHVLCEKPLALSLDDCAAIIAAQAVSKGKLMVGQVCKFAPAFVKAKEFVDKGLIGELFFVESEYAHDYRHFSDPNHWRRDPKLMRYPFLGGACHAVDLLRWVAGDPKEVSAYGNQKCLTDWPPVMDATIAIYKFPKDIIGKVFCSIGCKRPYTMRTVFYGTEGTIICDNTSPSIKIYADSFLPEKFASDQVGFTEIEVPVCSHNFAAETEAFIDSIVNDQPVELNGSEGAKTVAVCVATVQSAQQNKPVKISYL